MAVITRDGVTLAYERHGRGTPAFVFVHGWCCNRTFFAPQAEHFAKTHTVVSVDLRGHGESDKPQGGYSIAGFADDVADLIRELKLGKVVAVGHSMGGATVLQLGAAHPEDVAAIVMVDPAPIRSAPERVAARRAMVEEIEKGNQEPRRQAIERFFLPKSDPALKARVHEVMMAAPPHVAAGAMRAILEWDGPGAAARCKVPALHLAATPPLNPPHVMSESLPHVVNGWTVGAGHFNQLEAAVQVTSMIENFLNHHV